MTFKLVLNTKYARGEMAVVKFGRYAADASPAMWFESPEGVTLLRATVCPMGVVVGMAYPKILVKTYSENEGLMEWLRQMGLIQPEMHAIMPSRDVQLWVCKLSGLMMMEFEAQEKEIGFAKRINTHAGQAGG